jgi:hypothetical protein
VFWTAKLSGQTVQSAVAVLAIERVIRRSNALSLRVRMVIRDYIYGSASARPQTATARRGASTSEGEIKQTLKRRAQLIAWGRFG